MSPPAGAIGAAVAVFYIFLWASAFVPSRIAALDAAPLWFLVVRFFVAGSILYVASRAFGLAQPNGLREWGAIAVLGTMTSSLYLGCNYVALRQLSAGVGAIVASTNPLILALVAPRLLGEPLSRRKSAGLALGFGGVVAIMAGRAGTGTALPFDVALAFVGNIANVVGTIVFKRLRTQAHLISIIGIQLLAGGLVLIPVAVLFEGLPHALLTARLEWSFVYLVAVISIAASLIWFWLLAHGEASRVSAYYFLTPVFGLALGALLLGERVGLPDLLGLVAIAVGIAIVQRS